MAEYEVIGGREVLGHAPGERFSADLPEAQEKRLLANGSLRKAGAAQVPSRQQVSDPVPPVSTGPGAQANDVGDENADEGKE